MRNRDLVLYMGDVEITLPFRWEICPSCDGRGTDRGASVECDGGGFTASEWAEQDDDFRADYLAGRYDRACPHCEGGKIKVADESKMTPEEITAWHDQLRDDAEYESICRMERRMGA
jgi:RecJ-like exonuclease